MDERTTLDLAAMICYAAHPLSSILVSPIGYRLSVIAYRLSVIGYRLSVIGYRVSLPARRSESTRAA